MSSIQTAAVPAARLHAPTGASRVRYGILVLITIATVINYLDRTVLGIAAPTSPKNFRSIHSGSALPFQRSVGPMRLHSFRRHFSRSVWRQIHLFPVHGLLVCLHLAARCDSRIDIAAGISPRPGDQRSPLLSGECSDMRHLVPTA